MAQGKGGVQNKSDLLATARGGGRNEEKKARAQEDKAVNSLTFANNHLIIRKEKGSFPKGKVTKSIISLNKKKKGGRTGLYSCSHAAELIA